MSDSDRIPQVRLDNADVWAALQPRLEGLVLDNHFVLGEELDEFEKHAAQTFGCKWCVGVSSGTAALVLALKAGLRRGARVAIPANTFFATFEAVVTAGHTPVVVDNDDDYLIAVDQLEDLDVDAVIPVHLYGLPADMPAITELAEVKGWFVLEDASQAHGAFVGESVVGSLGNAAAFSAYPTKNLGAWGDAGFVTGDDPELEELIRRLRHHGQSERDTHLEIGGAERMDNLQALVLTEKLRRLPSEVGARRQVAVWYEEALAELQLVLPGDRGIRRHAFHQFVVRVPERDRVREFMQDAGIGTSIHYPAPVHLQPGALGLCEIPTEPAKAEAWASQILSLPMYASLSKADVHRIARTLKEALEGTAR